MRKQNIPRSSVSYIFRENQKYIQFPTHGKSEFPLHGKILGKQKYSKSMEYLHILRETETHTVPET